MRADLVEVELTFHRPMTTSSGTVKTRHSVLIALTDGDHSGWGEAASFPSGVAGTPDDSWDALVNWAGDPSSLPEVPVARAAVEAARMDLAARKSGTALHERLGGATRPVPARHALGIPGDVDELVAVTGDLHEDGIRFLKLKISPGSDVEPIRALAEAFPDLDVAVDANGTYTDPADPALATLDELGVSIVEQPFPLGDLVSHKLLRERIRADVCLDESVRTLETTAMALTAGAADMIAIKLGRHGWSDAFTILEQAREAGVAAKAGGTFDTSVGRRHLLALAALPGVGDAEVAPPSGYLTTDVGDYPPLVEGRVTPPEEPGIGFDPHIPDDLVVRAHTAEI